MFKHRVAGLFLRPTVSEMGLEAQVILRDTLGAKKHLLSKLPFIVQMRKQPQRGQRTHPGSHKQLVSKLQARSCFF